MKKVSLKIPDPLDVSWSPKSLTGAQSGSRVLADGRIQYWIEHEVLRGVTPQMLAWWFQNLEGDVQFAGKTYNRYRLWHPEDHVHVSYERRLPDGSVGPGAAIRIVEYLGRNRKYLVNVVSPIEKLDTTGYIHNPRAFGWLPIARMEYEFTAVAGGTFYRNSLIVGWRGFSFRLLRPLVQRFIFDGNHGKAWIKHNIEEVGQFEAFLPALYAAETANQSRVA
jgi:DAPG hydrolase PhiG domain